jgi:large subunit ribosomal protein L21
MRAAGKLACQFAGSWRGSRTSEKVSNTLMVYAIVRAGGRQEKVSVGDVLEIDRLAAEPGASVELPVLLLVDGDSVTTDKSALAKATVTVEVVAATKGPKIDILKYKNKTGYRKRIGHRSKLTQVRVTGIETK